MRPNGPDLLSAHDGAVGTGRASLCIAVLKAEVACADRARLGVRAELPSVAETRSMNRMRGYAARFMLQLHAACRYPYPSDP
jgi:hypothetical protein